MPRSIDRKDFTSQQPLKETKSTTDTQASFSGKEVTSTPDISSKVPAKMGKHPLKTTAERQVKPHKPTHKKHIKLAGSWSETLKQGAIKTALATYNAASTVKQVVFKSQSKIHTEIALFKEDLERNETEIAKKKQAIQEHWEKVEQLKAQISADPTSSQAEEWTNNLLSHYFYITHYQNIICGLQENIDLASLRIEYLQEKLAKNTKKTEKDLLALVSTLSSLGITLFSRLQNAYQHLKHMSDKTTVCEVAIPDIVLSETDEMPYPLKVTQAKVCIDQCHVTPEGVLEISIPKAQGKINTSERGTPSTVTLTDFQLRIGPPLGQAFADIINANMLSLPIKAMGLVKAIDSMMPPNTKDLPPDAASEHLIDQMNKCFDFNYPHITFSQPDQHTPDMEKAVIDAVLNIATPAFHKVRQQITKQLMKKTDTKIKKMQAKIIGEQRRYQEMTTTYERVQKDCASLLAVLPEKLKPRVKRKMLLSEQKVSDTQKEYESNTLFIKDMLSTEEAIAASQSFRLKQKHTHPEGGNSLKNMLTLFMGIRSLSQPDVHERTMHLPKQEFALSQIVKAELVNTTLTLSDVEVCDNGNLLINMPKLSTRCVLKHLMEGNTHEASVNIEDAVITVRPPIAGLLQKIFALPLPSSIEDIRGIREEIGNIVTMVKNLTHNKSLTYKKGEKNPLDQLIHNCFDISLKNASLHTPDSAWALTHGQPDINETDTEALASSIQEHTDIPVTGPVMQRLFNDIPSEDQTLHSLVIRLLQFVFTPEKITNEDGEVFVDAFEALPDSVLKQHNTASKPTDDPAKSVETRSIETKNVDNSHTEQTVNDSSDDDVFFDASDKMPSQTGELKEKAIEPAEGSTKNVTPPEKPHIHESHTSEEKGLAPKVLSPWAASNRHAFFKALLPDLFTKESWLFRFFTKRIVNVEIAVPTRQLSAPELNVAIQCRGNGLRNKIGKMLATRKLRKAFKAKKLQLDYSQTSLPRLIRKDVDKPHIHQLK